MTVSQCAGAGERSDDDSVARGPMFGDMRMRPHCFARFSLGFSLGFRVQTMFGDMRMRPDCFARFSLGFRV